MKKKKMVLILFFLFSFILFNGSVKALQYNEDVSCVAPISISKTKNALIGTSEHTVYKMKIGGHPAICIDKGKRMSNGTKMMIGACDGTNIPVIVRKAVNWCEANNCESSGIKYAAAQAYAWGVNSVNGIWAAVCTFVSGVNSNTVKVNPATGQKVMNQSGCSWVSNTEIKTYWEGLKSTPAGNNADFTCSATGNSKFQRVVTKKAKKVNCNNSIEPTKHYCPPGTKNAGMEITKYVEGGMTLENVIQIYCKDQQAACIGYAWRTGGGLSACSDNQSPSTSSFSEHVAEGSADFTGHQKYGKKLDITLGTTGIYCAVYCHEVEAKVQLPGSLGAPIALGSTITWPTSEATSNSRFGNLFPIKFSGRKECTVRVAPDLTYGNSCNLKPDKIYDDYRKELKQYKEAGDRLDLAGLVSKANKANSAGLQLKTDYVDFDVTATKLKETGKLNHKNEKILKTDNNIHTYLHGLDTYNVDGDKFWGQYKYKVYGNENAAKAEDAYKKGIDKYCTNNRMRKSHVVKEGKKEVAIAPGVIQIVPDPTQNEYGCDNGRTLTANSPGEVCECNETAAKKEHPPLATMETYMKNWQAYRSAINARYNNYVAYINAYRKTVNLYWEIKLCANFGADGVDEDGGSSFSCGGDTCDFYNFVTSAQMEYTDEKPGYGTTHGLMIERGTKYSCTNCSKVPMYLTKQLVGQEETGYNFLMNTATVAYLQGRIKAINERTMSLNAGETTYSLPNGLYNYLDKNKNEFVMNKPGTNNFQTLGLTKNYDFEYSNLPTSWHNIPGKKYKLIIKDLTLGDDGQFTAGAEGVSIGDYVCNYEVALTIDECLCPPGTKWEDVDLYQALLNSNGSMTCADAKVAWCNNGPIPKCEPVCVVEKYCPDGKTKVTSCVNSGHSLSYCQATMCIGKQTCPPGTKHSGMDITSCIQAKMSQGASRGDADNYCKNVVCNLNNLFIYRTIDLKNPFPSYDADKTVSQNSLNYNKFNLNVKGRYPGYNWNSVGLVNTKIINNAGVHDYEIYNKKPLYHIELNRTKIMAIRAYNQKQAKNDEGYNDFTLNCVKTDEGENYFKVGTACYSSFVHNPQYGFDTTGAKSTCGGAGTTTSLYNCLNS